MKYRKEIAGFRKEKGVNYNTTVTATKGEQIAIWISVVIFMIMVLLSIFVFKSVIAFIIVVATSILSIFLMMIVFIFRPIHKEERLKNTVKCDYKIDISYNNITNKYTDNSEINIRK